MQLTRHDLAGRLGFWAFVAFIAAYLGVLSGAMFAFQFGLAELPCPLCIAQRMGMMLSALGAIYIVVNALRGTLSSRILSTGLGMSVLGAVLGAAMSVRQVLLHIAPGDPGYGDAVYGMHLYSWALVSFVVVVVFVGAFLITGDTFTPVAPTTRWLRILAWVVVWGFIITIALNMVVVFAEEGFNWFLPDDPTQYQLFTQ